MSKSKLEYWSGSAWVEAKTIDFGSGTQNALISVEIEDTLNNPMKANIVLNNAAREPFSTGTAADRYGPLTTVFTDFQPIRIIETDTNVVLFSGKLYDIKNEFTMDKGQTIKLYARDNLAEIADYNTEGKDSYLVQSTTNKRSDKIKQIINDGALNPNRTSLNISTDNISYADTTKFENSVRNFDRADKLYINTLGKQGLKAIYQLAKNDPHNASGEVSSYGYDYYVDSKHILNYSTGTASQSGTTVTGSGTTWTAAMVGDVFSFTGGGGGGTITARASNTSITVSNSATVSSGTYTIASNPAQDFNYFKRGTRPPFQGTPSNFTGFWVEYPIVSADIASVNASSMKHVMFPDYDFNLPKKDLYTSCTAAISRELVSTDPNGNEETEGVNFSMELEILDVTNISGLFTWKGKRLSTKTRTFNDPVGDFAETLYINDGGADQGTVVGRIQYQSSSASDSSGYILISWEPDTYTNTNLSGQKKAFDALSGTVPLRGSSSGATLNYNTATGRPSKNFGVQRPLRLSGNDTRHVDSMRSKVASALSRSKATRTECTVRTSPPPFNYIETYATAAPSASQITITAESGKTPYDRGLRIGMTIAKVDSTGTQTAYGYVTAIAATSSTVTTVTAALNTGDWSSYTGSSNKLRFYIPVRASHYMYAKNPLVNFTGYMFIKNVTYTEGTGVQMSLYKGTGVNTAGEAIGLGVDPNAIVATITNETGKIVENLNIPMGGLGWTFTEIDGSETAVFSRTDRDTITWTAGRFTIGGSASYKIRAGNSGNMTTTINSNTGYPHIYKVIFDPNQTPDSNGTYIFEFIKHDLYYSDIDHINMGVARAALLSANNAIITFDGSGTGLFGGIDATGEDQFVASLFKKTLQPYTTTAVVSAGTYNGANKHRYVSSTAGTISFADDTVIDIEANTSMDLGTTANTVWYIFFKLVTSGNAETDDYSEVNNAEVYQTVTYSEATSGSRGLLAIVSTGANTTTSSPYDEIAVQAFHGKGQNITADTIAANAITAEAIKADSIKAEHILIESGGNGGIGGITASGTLNLANIGNGNLDNIPEDGTYKKTTATQRDGGGYAATGLNSSGQVKLPIGSGTGAKFFSYGSISNGSSNSAVVMDNLGLKGVTDMTLSNDDYTTLTGGNTQFEIRATDGKGVFGGGIVTLDKAFGITIGNGENSGVGFLRWTAASELDSFIYRLQADSGGYDKGTMIWNVRDQIVFAGDVWADPNEPSLGELATGSHYWGDVVTQKVSYNSSNSNIEEFATIEGPTNYSGSDSTTAARYRIILPTSIGSTNEILKINSISTTTGLNMAWAADATSSLRYKENITALNIDTARIFNLVPKSFTWKKDMTGKILDPKGTDKPSFGYIAEEVEKILPEILGYDEENKPKQLDYKLLSVLLLEEVKKLKTRVDLLEGG